ncbi:DUF4231 domain-containing protein [Microbacterium sp. VKM Ac-2870]|uniref:DUF4231 domain-containing protein n=1 Tax=Microbacterium sp. VKM Ac-2870 TaxID=2783825 RepID=UPI00188CF509|nr:DUF4231 domain-containing protein [Microbacterium sp. VKM Ac-2870]MBF4563120.1 DUF4231 domain-containing protein [Microbacterium sp. VKM Ac-2870]
MPALWKAADDASAANQRLFFNVKRWELVGLVTGALAALLPTSWLWGFGPGLSVLAFLLVVALQVASIGPRAEARWYDARAAAESIKSASWQYAVGGEAFRLKDADSDARFFERLREILNAVPKLDIGPASGATAGVTSGMRAIRGRPRAERMSIYRDFRVQDQVQWYARKADENRARGRLFKVIIIVVESAAVIYGLIRYKFELDTDILGVLAATGAGLIAWAQAKKYAFLAESYSVTSHEIELVAATLESVASEDQWAQLVHDSEAAFSREHTMWQARRQGPA